MSLNPVVNEIELDRVLLCPMMVPGIDNNMWAYECACDTLRWAIRKTFDCYNLSLKEIRDKYMLFWDALWFKTHQIVSKDDIPLSGPYWKGPRQAIKTSKKIYDFLKLCYILMPEQPYELPLEGYTIQGRYSLVRKRGKNSIVMILVYEAVERNHHSKPESTLPQASSLARYIHVKNTYHEYKEVGIYHLPLIHGTPWINKYVEERLATNMLRSIVNVIKVKPFYAIPGSHCEHCSTKPCLEVLREKNQFFGII